MTKHSMTAGSGEVFEVVLDDEGRITDVAGPWPAGKGAEFELRGDVPQHVAVEGVPAHVQEFGASRGATVCMYDPNGCRTCFCDADGSVLYCRNMC